MQNKLLSIVFSSIFIASCGGGGGGGGSSTPTPPTPPANNAPTFANVGTIGVAENTTAIGTVTATDADGDTLTYSVTGDDASSVSIGSGTGVLAFNTAPDFENPGSASGDNNYSITVVASDGSATGSVGVVVSVTDVDENTNSAPAFTSPASYSVNENTTAIGTVSATDADNDTLTFSVSGTDSNLVSVDASSGELLFNTAPDYENPIDSGSDNTYVISIAANDGTTSTTQKHYSYSC
jgi:serralysin